jgi:thioredoxin reductase (NADPH)
MTSPVLMAVDDNPDGLRTLDDALRRRYERDYLVIGETSPGTALGRLRELRAAGHPVAVLMAASAMTATPGSEFLAQARSIQPIAKRVLVVPRGGPGAPSLRVPVLLVQDRQAATPVLRAIALGMIDTYLSAPGAGRDEEFHRAVSELLEEWAHDAVPALPACGSSRTNGRLARMSCVTRWPVTASPMSFTPPGRRMAGRGCSRPGRTVRRSRSW